MRVATVRTARGPRAAVFCRTSGADLWIDISEAADHVGIADFPWTMRSILQREGPGLATVRQIERELREEEIPLDVSSWPMEGARLASPVPDPGVLIDFYAFEEHVRRARARRGLEIIPEWYRYPVYYRSNQRAVIGPDSDPVFPRGEDRLDYELELAAILGTPLENPTPEEAEAAIAGYCLFNDWSARTVQAEVMKVGLGPAKGKDFASSLGPWMVTPDELGPLQKVELSARVNGETWSRGAIGAMRWTWGEMLAFAGENVRFEPGDIFGSGTVGGGCGLELGKFLSPGDRVELDGGPALGTLAATVRIRDREV